MKQEFTMKGIDMKTVYSVIFLPFLIILLLVTPVKGSSEERWIYYGESKDGIFYYDKKNITNVRPNVVKVLVKNKISKLGKDETIQLRKEHQLPIKGWDKLDYQMIVQEVNCKKYTRKSIKFIYYGDEGEILYVVVDDSNSSIEQIVPDSMGDTLRKKVCK